MDLVSPGEYRLALLDPATKEIRELPAFPSGKHITPQWSADGRQLFFISDRDGISNLYRLDRDEDRFYQITNLYTGISGISSLSPSLTIASQTNDILYGVYDRRRSTASMSSTRGRLRPARRSGGGWPTGPRPFCRPKPARARS